MPSQPAAFLSYARFNDQHDDGWVSQFCERLSAEVRVQLGEEFPIFQDRKDIVWGQSWQRRIDQTLDAVTLLLVIITPGFFRSSACRAEVERFRERERELGRDDLILPLYYVSTPELDDPERRDADELARVLSSRQFADWRELRFEPLPSPKARRAVAQLATRMRDTFWRSAANPSSRPREQVYRAAEQSRSPKTGPAAQVTTNTDPQVHLANPPAAAGRTKASKGSDRLSEQVEELNVVLPFRMRDRSRRELADMATLVERARGDLYGMVQRIGGYDDASDSLVLDLGDVGSFLRQLSERVEDIGEGQDRESELTPLLRQLSSSIRVARDAINDFKVTVADELAQRTAESERHDHRTRKRFREDQQEIRALGRAAEGELKGLREFMMFFVERATESLPNRGDVGAGPDSDHSATDR